MSAIRFEPIKKCIGSYAYVDKAHLCDDAVVAACVPGGGSLSLQFQLSDRCVPAVGARFT